ADGKRRITILDRDPPAPEGDAEDAFQHWERRGATQLRHSHVFLGRLTTLLRNRYPALLEELLASGARVFGFEDGLPPSLKAHYVKQTGDEDLSILFSRRTTLELAMRRYTARLPGVTFVTEAGVRGIVMDGASVKGLQVEHGGALTDMLADVTIDASGRNTPFPDWLRAHGAVIAEEESP